MSLFKLPLFARAAGVFCAAALFATQAWASLIAIDTFNDTASPSMIATIYPGVNSASDSEVGLSTSETVFGQRDVALVADAPVVGVGFGNMAVAGGKFSLGTNTIVAPYTATATVTWTNQFTVDLVDDDGNPNNGIVVQFLSADHAGQLTFTAYNGATAVAVTKNFAALESPFLVTIGFAEFTGAPSFDWTMVSKLDMALGSTADGDYEIDYVGTSGGYIPEPASLSLIGLGVIGLIRRRK